MIKLVYSFFVLLGIVISGYGGSQWMIHHKANEKPITEYLFRTDNQKPEKLLIDVINGAKSTLDVAIYSLNNADIVNAIIEARKRGVQVRIITDQIESNKKLQRDQLEVLLRHTIPIKTNTHDGLMHLKVMIADKSVLTTGSSNYSVKAATKNDEVIVRINDEKIAEEWSAEFNRMWQDELHFRRLK